MPPAQHAHPAGQLVVAVAPGRARRVEQQRHAGQLRADAVVQVAAQPAALLLAAGDDPLAAALQVGDQPGGLHERTGPAGHLGQRRLLLRAEAAHRGGGCPR